MPKGVAQITMQVAPTSDLSCAYKACAASLHSTMKWDQHAGGTENVLVKLNYMEQKPKQKNHWGMISMIPVGWLDAGYYLIYLGQHKSYTHLLGSTQQQVTADNTALLEYPFNSSDH